MVHRWMIGCAALVLPGAANADELADRVCPLIQEVATKMGDKAEFAVQADLVMAIGAAYAFDGEKLKAVMRDIDTSTTESCPEARSQVLDRVKLKTLSGALR